jgi:hypothetical protein
MSILEERLANDAQMEQSAAAQRGIGRVQAAYYVGLVEGGCDPELAAVLLQQMTWLSWHKVHYPDFPPEVMPGG